MKRIDTIIFDWAGTSIDFGCFAPVQSFLEAFSALGIEITVEEARAPMGMKKFDHVKAILTMQRVADQWIAQRGTPPQDSDVEEIYHHFEDSLFGQLKHFCTPLPSVCETVDKLRNEEVKIGSTTGYTREMMDILMPLAASKGFNPDMVVTSTDVPRGRPYPYMIWQNAIQLESPDLACICKVGDTVSDIQEGRNAGVWSVASIVGSNEWALTERETDALSSEEKKSKMEKIEHTFFEAGAHFVLKDMSELSSLIHALNGELAVGKNPGCF